MMTSRSDGPQARVLAGDLFDVLPGLAPASIHCVVTSPPYWGLRDYGVPPRDWPDGWRGALGLEPAVELYVRHLVEAFREVRRALREDGTAWLVLGDSYARSPSPGLKAKDLALVPARAALALQADGWWVRADVVWAKRKVMPESVTDRPTRAHETVLLLARSPRYFYDAAAVAEPCTSGPSDRRKMAEGLDRLGGKTLGETEATYKGNRAAKIGRRRAVGDGATRNLRSVWTIETVPYRGAHFAAFPPELVARCVRAGSSEGGACPACGAQAERQLGAPVPAAGRGSLNRTRRVAGEPGEDGWDGDRLPTHLGSSVPWAPTTRPTVGWRLPCGHAAGPLVPATVLDPFGGSGTTAAVAVSLGRAAVYVDVNPAYAELARQRIGPLLVREAS